jgi:L-alanine-DL-glutamate epimerase-like enolase superfamily enzyme
MGAVSFLQGDVRHHWGYTGCWEAVAYCADPDRDVQFVPHHFGTHLGLVANAHLTAAAPGAALLEYPVFGDDVAAMYPFPLAAELLATDLDLSDGRLRLPDGPGLGVEVDVDVVDRYPYVEGPWTEFRYDDESVDDG